MGKMEKTKKYIQTWKIKNWAAKYLGMLLLMAVYNGSKQAVET